MGHITQVKKLLKQEKGEILMDENYEEILKEFWKLVNGIPNQHTIKGFLELEKKMEEKNELPQKVVEETHS